MNMLQNSQLSHDVRVLAYLLLFEKFNDLDLVNDIVKFLEEKNTPYNLKSFILTHLKSAGKDRSPNKSR